MSKRLMTATFGSSELLRLMGTSEPFLHTCNYMESTNSLIHVHVHVLAYMYMYNVPSVYMEIRANQANGGKLFWAGWPSSAPCMHGCSVTA